MARVTRRRYWRAAAVHAYRWLVGVTDHLGRLLFVLGLIGLSLAGAVWDYVPWWAAAVGAAILAAVAVEEGAYRAWREAAAAAEGAESDHQRAERRGEVRDQLGRFMREARALYELNVASDAELDEWRTDVEKWFQVARAWIHANLGDAELAVFEDLSSMLAASVVGSYDRVHSDIRLRLSQLQENLRELIAQQR